MSLGQIDAGSKASLSGRSGGAERAEWGQVDGTDDKRDEADADQKRHQGAQRGASGGFRVHRVLLSFWVAEDITGSQERVTGFWEEWGLFDALFSSGFNGFWLFIVPAFESPLLQKTGPSLALGGTSISGPLWMENEWKRQSA